jgi:small GTP-binding protein
MTYLLERHKQAKSLIGEQLKKLGGIAEAVGMRTLERDIRASRLPKLESEHFHLVVLGEFNHGKSTFVNALLGDEVLPTGITPTTAAINHVVHAERPRARAVLQDGTTVDLEAGALEDWVTVTGSRSKDVRYVEVGYPAEPLRENITLVDTPGVNDLNEQRAEITYGYVPRADAVIFLLDSGQALKDSEREFLASHVLEGSRNRMVFVLGKVDLLSESEREAVLRYVRKELASFADEPVVFPVSARDWLSGKKAESGLPELLEYLKGFLETDRARLLLDNAAADASRTAAYLEKNLGVKLRAYDLDLAELEQRVASVREQLNASKKTLDGLHGRIRAECEAIKSQVHLDLDTFARKFIEAIPGQIDAVDAGDVKAFIGAFVEDKFREWSELEGAKIASMLEHLAEDVIAVTNENVAAASAALADRLGPADTEVDIDIDSFKYDVGVYAVGALGTTVFLFVNTLAGGLLTLAAPVFAIMIKSKVAGDIKEQAKERVPASIHRAADVMRPHFDQVIDEFTTRLGEFVTSAGNTLYKGISEILDQTIDERRTRASELEALRTSTEELVQRARASQELLGQLRESLWSDEDPDAAAADVS